MGLLALAGIAAWRQAQVWLPVSRGEFPDGTEYLRTGTGETDVLWVVGSPIRAAPPSRLVQQLLSLQYRPLLEAGCSVWTVGRRRHLPAGHTVQDMADDLAALIEQQFDGHVELVVGVSFGGFVGQYLAARHPTVLSRLALVVSGWRTDPWSREIDRRFVAALRAGDKPAARAISMEYLAPAGSDPPSLPPFVTAMLWRLMGLDGIPLGDLALEAAAEVDTRAVLPEIELPVLLVAGDRDRFFPPDVVEETAALLPDCTLVWHEGQGHLDAAGDVQTAREILDFLRGG